MNSSQVALVTGANQGIGFEIAKALHAEGITVLVGARDLRRGQSATREIGPNAVPLQLDVTDAGSIAAAAERVRSEFGCLHILVQNAAIAKVPGSTETGEEFALANRPGVVSIEWMRSVWETNVFGVLAVYQAMLPMLRAASNARIVNVSSGAGSLTIVSDPTSPLRPLFDVSYAASKTALNALTVAMAIELEGEGIAVNAVSPGFTSTAMTGFIGTDTAAEGAAEAVRLALLKVEAPTGTFRHASLGNVPW